MFFSQVLNFCRQKTKQNTLVFKKLIDQPILIQFLLPKKLRSIFSLYEQVEYYEIGVGYNKSTSSLLVLANEKQTKEPFRRIVIGVSILFPAIFAPM